MPGLPVHHQVPEFTQTHILQVGDAIQPSHPLSSLFPPAPNPFQHQSLFQLVNSSGIKMWYLLLFFIYYLYSTAVSQKPVLLSIVVYIIGEGNGTPLQYSWLENPNDGGAWQAAVHGVAKSRTRLSDFTFTHWRRKWKPAPVVLPGESQGWWSLMGCRLGGRTESDTTEAT